jgi:uncharacterized repeat protein (TIGR03806 family)
MRRRIGGSKERISLGTSRLPSRRWLACGTLVMGIAAAWGLFSVRGSAMYQRRPIRPYLNDVLPQRWPGVTSHYVVEEAFPKLAFDDPTLLTHDGLSDWLYVCGRQGIIERFARDRETTSKHLFLDLRSRCQGWDDGGLLGLAFHPEFGREGRPNRGYLYVWYSHADAPTSGPARPEGKRISNRLSRFLLPDGASIVDPNSELVLIDQGDDDLFHNGGGMFFHPDDGFLYLSLGDEGFGGENAQYIDRNLFGGVIRIDVDCRGGSISHPPPRQPTKGRAAHYFIPNDNPWVGVPGALEEFWCVGLRNPHRMTCDPVDKTIIAGDVGEQSREEINIILKGANYQWNLREGEVTIPANRRPPALVGFEQPPFHQYPRSEGVAVIGGYVYRGKRLGAEVIGKYIYGDYNGRVWSLDLSARGAPEAVPLCDLPLNPGRAYGAGLSSFGTDRDGEIYMCVIGDVGRIFRFSPRALGPDFDRSPRPPRWLSETGAFRDLKTLEPAEGVLPYEVNTPLWSDGAAKRRWMAVPNDGPPYSADEQVGFYSDRPWTFPAGTVFIKHFEIAQPSRPSLAARRLETRFLVCDSDGGVYGATYRWNAVQSDAALIEERESEEVTFRSPSGDRTQIWEYPGRRDCLSCHTAAAGYVLGVNARQLNRDIAPSRNRQAQSHNQLLIFEGAGMFSSFPPVSSLASVPRMAEVGDASTTLDERVRSYLDANCSHCHRPNGVRAFFDARYETPLDAKNLVGAITTTTSSPRGSFLVVGGDPEQSTLLKRMESSDAATRMPPLARNTADQAAIAAVREWITQLPLGGRQRTVFLSDVELDVLSNGWGPLERDRSNADALGGDGRTLTLNGRTYAKGLGVHAPSDVRYRLSGDFSRFISEIGVDDEVGASGSVTFQVWADGVLLFETSTVTGLSPTGQIDVDVTGRQELRLIVTEGDDGHSGDHADWAAARLVPRNDAH